MELVFEDFDKYLKVIGLSEYSIRLYFYSIDRFKGFIRKKGLKETTASDFLSSIVSQSAKLQAYNAIKHLYEFNDKPFINTPRVKRGVSVSSIYDNITIISPNLFRTLVERIKRKEVRTMIYSIYCMGLRAKEVARLTIGDIELGDKIINIPGIHSRLVLIPDILYEDFENQYADANMFYSVDAKKFKAAGLKRNEYPLFPSTYSEPDTRYPLRNNLEESIIRKNLIRASEKLDLKPLVSVDMLRHSYAYSLYLQRCSVDYIREAMGYREENPVKNLLKAFKLYGDPGPPKSPLELYNISIDF